MKLHVLTFCLVLIPASICIGQTTEFTFQGNLSNSGTPANGSFDFEFVLFDSLNGGNQLGSTLARNAVAVTNGVFAVRLDFGSQFPGTGRFLEIHVRQTGQQGITILAPRQSITSEPYAMQSLNATTAATATNSTQLGGVSANQFVLTTDTRMSDSRNPLPNSANYIQNTISQQTSSNFNISGSGQAGGTLTANAVNAFTQYNIGINNTRVLFTSGGTLSDRNVFVGIGAGLANPTGLGNSFLGRQAGGSNTSGNLNTFVGADAAQANTAGSNNTAVGASTVVANTLTNATAVGAQAQVTQSNSMVLGAINGLNGATADTNVGIGTTAPTQRLHVVGNGFFTGELTVVGNLNTTITNAATQFEIGGQSILSDQGVQNLFVGIGAGPSASGSSNSFFGFHAGGTSTSGSSNSFFGQGAGAVNTTGANNSFFGAIAGTSNTNGAANAFFGAAAGASNSGGSGNSFFGTDAGDGNTSGANNTFIGNNAGITSTTTSGNTAVGASSQVSGSITNATAIGFDSIAEQSNSLILGSINGKNGATADTRVGIGTTTPAKHLHVFGAGDQEIAVESSDVNGKQWTLQSSRGTSNGIFQIIDRTLNLSRLTIDAAGNLGVGDTSPSAKVDIAANGGHILMGDAGCNAGFTGIGFGTSLSGCSNFALLSDGSDTVINRPSGAFIAFRANNVTQMSLAPTGELAISTLGSAGSTALCRNASNQIATCSSSIRYKSNIASFSGGLELVKRLRPVSFQWKESGAPDVGLVAEEVNKVEPLLTSLNDKGQVEGVKYDRIGVVLVNAVKEQQAQIDSLKKERDVLRAQFDAQAKAIEKLKALVCKTQPEAEICHPAQP